MKPYFKIFFAGLFVSFLGALPFGTLNITAFKISASQSVISAIYFAVAVVLVELIFVRLTLIKVRKKWFNHQLSFVALPIAGLFLLFLGISTLLSINQIGGQKFESHSFVSIQSPVILGLLLSTLNPLQIPYWLGWNAVLTERKILKNTMNNRFFYILGIGIGSLAALIIFIFLGALILENHQNYQTIITAITGLMYVGFSGYLFFLFYKKHRKNIRPYFKSFKNYLDLKLYKLRHWEFWSMRTIYYPLFPFWLFNAIRARSFFFFNTANPSIKNGGMVMESKKEIYDLIPNEYIPETIYIEKNSSFENVLELLKKSNIQYPFIVKPDIGMKAFGVAKIHTENQLKNYFDKISIDFLIQGLIEFPVEIGIFYVRHPKDKKGKITGIVSKEFLTVIGDGKSTILDLIQQNPRSRFQLKSLIKKHGKTIYKVLPVGEEFILVPFGSHTRGAKFIDDTHKLTDEILKVIDDICIQIPDFHYGRLDIRMNSFDKLGKGKEFSIIEVNGAGSEPTHIYDPKHSIFFAWKEIIRHWNILYQISAYNKKKGYNYLSFKEGKAIFKSNSELEQHLKLI